MRFLILFEFEFSKIDEFFVDIIVPLKLFFFEMIMMIVRWFELIIIDERIEFLHTLLL